MYHFTALVTCLAIAFYFFTSIQVSKARVAFGIKVPAITGNPGVSRADEHAGMDADLPALTVAVCDLHQRCHRSRAGSRLDRRPHPLHDRLFAGRRKTRAGFWHSSQRCHHTLAERVGRDSLAPHSCVSAGKSKSKAEIAPCPRGAMPRAAMAPFIREDQPFAKG